MLFNRTMILEAPVEHHVFIPSALIYFFIIFISWRSFSTFSTAQTIQILWKSLYVAIKKSLKVIEHLLNRIFLTTQIYLQNVKKKLQFWPGALHRSANLMRVKNLFCLQNKRDIFISQSHGCFFFVFIRCICHKYCRYDCLSNHFEINSYFSAIKKRLTNLICRG